MKRSFFTYLLALSLVSIISGCSETKTGDWKIGDSPLLTRWATDVSPEIAWPEYPRPQMVRENWMNLNGLWAFAISPFDSMPIDLPDKILVPYPVESALSGIGKRVGPQQKLWYQREITIPADWTDKTVLLHFEASDWETTVWINQQEAGIHRGGYDPFSFDITPLLKTGKTQLLTVSVWDPTDEGFQPRGKQVSDPRGIWYTPSSGIWQTVWMEPVPESYIESFQLFTDIDQGKLKVNSNIKNQKSNSEIEVEVVKGDQVITSKAFGLDQVVEVLIPDPELWSPDTPELYDLRIRLLLNHAVVDEIGSYFGMRKISIVKDERGFNRLALNNKVLFQNGPLDQGFWPDGLNTPPSDEAMKYDIGITKAMGFNMLRKHVKVENRRFYQWCDKLGILVWQDMPSAAGFIAPDGDDLNPSEEHKSGFEAELTAMIETHFNHPSIVMWVPFNEGWGQYDTERIVDRIRSADPTRLVNNASGWTDRMVGDVIDIHHYPDPRCPEPQENRASVLGEFGGLGLYVEGHTWQQENWGYEKLEDVNELLAKYEDYYDRIKQMKEECGLAAVIYTQTTDVETETNGLMTYDRDRVKMGAENILKAHLGIIPPRLITPLQMFIENVNIELGSADPEAVVQYCLVQDGKEDQWVDYSSPFLMSAPFILNTRAVWPDGNQSRESRYAFEQVSPLPPVKNEAAPGLNIAFYEGTWDQLPDFDQLTPLKAGITGKADLAFTDATELFGLVFEGYLDVPETGVYMIYLSSDDGARLFLDEKELIAYDGIHGAGFRKSVAALEKGLHPFRLVYFQKFGGLGLNLFWESNTMEYQEISPGNWKH